MGEQIEKPPEQPESVIYVRGRIAGRVARADASPTLTPEQKTDISQFASLTKFALFLGNPIPAIYFAEKLIELTDPLMVPEEDAGKKE